MKLSNRIFYIPVFMFSQSDNVFFYAKHCGLHFVDERCYTNKVTFITTIIVVIVIILYYYCIILLL